MATLGFLLDPDRELPADPDCDWFGRCTGFMSGTWMAWQKLKSSLNPADLPNRPWFDAPSLTTNAADYMAFMRPEHEKQYQNYVDQRHAEWIKQGQTRCASSWRSRRFETWSGQPSKLSASHLLSYRASKPSRQSKENWQFCITTAIRSVFV
jgi:hypothetical protein